MLHVSSPYISGLIGLFFHFALFRTIVQLHETHQRSGYAREVGFSFIEKANNVPTKLSKQNTQNESNSKTADAAFNDLNKKRCIFLKNAAFLKR